MSGRDTRQVDGATALLRAPEGFAPHIQLSFYLYPWGIKEMRRRLGWAHNRQGVVVIRLTAPIQAPPIDLALDAASLYLFGVRAPPDGPWYCFRDYPRPADPPGAPVRAVIPGEGSYRELGLPETIDRTPIDILNGIRSFDGRLSPDRARDLVALMFLVPEALRFDSILDEGMRYLHHFRLHCAAHKDRVTNWATGTAGHHPDIILPHIPKV